jgi:hypothetical protein
MPPSIPLDRFNRIVQAPDPVSEIVGLVNPDSPTSEDDWLDCKREPDDIRDPKRRENKIKEMWLQALCGFANNEGGLLIWGLDARKDPKTNVDQVVGAVPVTDPHGLKTKLTEWRREGTDPPLANVQVEAYESSPGSGKGFVVCYVPEGSYKPYRTREGDRSQYWLRTSDSFVVMSSSVLRAMFHPRPRAVFVLEAVLSWRPVDVKHQQFRWPVEIVLEVKMTNRGTGSGKDVVLRMDHNLSQGQVDRLVAGWHFEDWTVRKSSPIHQGMPLATVLIWKWVVAGTTSRPNPWSSITPDCPNPEFKFTVYAENQEPQSFEARFDLKALLPERPEVVEASPREAF